MFIFSEVEPAGSGDPKGFIFIEMSMIFYRNVNDFVSDDKEVLL